MGYQDLAVFSGVSSSGMHWRCELQPYESLVIENGNVTSLAIDYRDDAHHTSGESGNEYFGWKDCRSASARELAEKILERFPTLLSACRRENHKYSGWLVSAVGHAEAGHLPVFYSDYGAENRAEVVGSLAHNPPPLQAALLIGERRSFFARPPHLRPDDDWHSAYIHLITAWRASSIRRLPAYPKDTGDIYEIGAYWEGGIWYIQEVIGITRIEEFLDQLRSPPPSSERWATFLAVWNSEGQLEFLVAFFIRHLICGNTTQRFDPARRNEYEIHLRSFEAAHESFDTDFPNPYFGGSNPLHLGMILSGTFKDEVLVYS